MENQQVDMVELCEKKKTKHTYEEYETTSDDFSDDFFIVDQVLSFNAYSNNNKMNPNVVFLDFLLHETTLYFYYTENHITITANVRLRKKYTFN